MRNRVLSFFAAVLFVVSFSASAHAETFYAYLSAAQEVPANMSSATGYARVFVNESTLTITFTVVFNNLSSAQTGAHMHNPAALGANGPIIVNFGTPGGTSGTITGTGTITAAQLAQIRQHLAYVNVHSSNNPGGEIRGQLGIKRPVDFDGDGRQDYSVLKFPNVAPPGVASMAWWNLNSTVGAQVVAPAFADANRDFPVPGDFDGDGKDDYAVFRANATGVQSEYFILKSTNSTVQYYAWGIGGDLNVARDFDGDGITDPAVFRRGAVGSTANWYIRLSTNGLARIVPFGTSGATPSDQDFPIPGDYDGDGKFDVAVYRAGALSPTNTFIVFRSSDSAITYQPFGNFTTDYVLPGDYDGDGKYDFAVARTGAAGTDPMVWWIVNSGTGSVRIQQWGISSDLPVQGDYDGDARADIAIYRKGALTTSPSSFWVYRSFDNTGLQTLWGQRPDFPVANFDAR